MEDRGVKRNGKTKKESHFIDDSGFIDVSLISDNLFGIVMSALRNKRPQTGENPLTRVNSKRHGNE